jgi:hypothetical protein
VGYLLKSFIFGAAGQRLPDKMVRRAKSVECAKDNARSMLRSVPIRHQKADLREIKDPMGNIWRGSA